MLESITPVIGKVSHWEKEEKERKEGRERSANVANEERTAEENEYDPEGNEIENEFLGESWGVNFTSGGDDPSSDLDWDGIENFGTDSEVEFFLQNNEDTQGYEDLQTTTDVDVFRIFAKEQIARGRNGKTTKFSTI